MRNAQDPPANQHALDQLITCLYLFGSGWLGFVHHHTLLFAWNQPHTPASGPTALFVLLTGFVFGAFSFRHEQPSTRSRRRILLVLSLLLLPLLQLGFRAGLSWPWTASWLASGLCLLNAGAELPSLFRLLRTYNAAQLPLSLGGTLLACASFALPAASVAYLGVLPASCLLAVGATFWTTGLQGPRRQGSRDLRSQRFAPTDTRVAQEPKSALPAATEPSESRPTPVGFRIRTASPPHESTRSVVESTGGSGGYKPPAAGGKPAPGKTSPALARVACGLVAVVLLWVVPGWFLCADTHVPVDQHSIAGKRFTFQRHRRLSVLRVQGPKLDYFSSEAHRRSEAIVHPAMLDLQGPAEVLVLGAEKGHTLREILRYPGVQRITLLTPHPAQLALFRRHPLLVAAHQDSFRDPRVRLVTFSSEYQLLHALTRETRRYHRIFQDLPFVWRGQSRFDSRRFFRQIRRLLHPQGRYAFYWGPLAPFSSYAHALRRLQQTPFFVRPYRAFGLDITWGFALCAKGPFPLTPRRILPGLRYLQPNTLSALFHFPLDTPLPSPTMHPPTSQPTTQATPTSQPTTKPTPITKPATAASSPTIRPAQTTPTPTPRTQATTTKTLSAPATRPAPAMRPAPATRPAPAMRPAQTIPPSSGSIRPTTPTRPTAPKQTIPTSGSTRRTKPAQGRNQQPPRRREQR